MPLLSQRDYATHRGCSASAVAKAVSEGRITLVDGKIDPDKADKEWAKNTNPAYHPEKSETGTRPKITLTDAKTQIALVDLRSKKLDLDERTGTLINADNVYAQGQTLGEKNRDDMSVIGARVTPKIIKIISDSLPTGLRDEFLKFVKSQEIQNAIDDEIDIASEDLLNELRTTKFG